jgi:hypothetical protein
MSKFLEAFLVCALWSSTDGDKPLDDTHTIRDFAPETLAKLTADCARFQTENAALLAASGLSDEQAGHDFWLTRCGHGAGFWDRGLGEVGERLTEAAKVFGNVDLYVGDDGKVWA